MTLLESRKPPFGMGPIQPGFDRATRLAKALFGALEASVVLVDGEHIWRSRDQRGAFTAQDPVAAVIMDLGEPLWVEDLADDPRFSDNPMVTGGPCIRFYAGAPMQMADGSTPGVLCVVTKEPRPLDARLLNRLRDPAEGVADECERGKASAAQGAGAAAPVPETETAKAVLASLVATVPVTIVMTDREMRALYVNPRWRTNFGMEHAEIIGRSLYDIAPDYYPQFKQSFEACLGGRIIRSPRVRSEHSGRVEWLRSELTPWRDADGNVGGIIISAHYITELIEGEHALIQAKNEAEAANQAKSIFLATMSHEIRTPLNGVLGMAQAMAAEELSNVQRGRLDVIRQSGETLLAILNDVLDLSKIEAGKLQLEEAEFDMAELVRGAHALFSVMAEKKGLSFDLSIEPSALGVYQGDTTRVRQILYNLMSNALKFTEAGEIHVAVRRSRDGLRFVVSDTGIGMGRETVASIFSKFVQADASTTRRFGGTGLGLSISRELASLMNGDILVESELGAGSKFTARLKLERLRAPDRNAAKVTTRVAEPRPTAEAEIRILAAEDNAINQLVLKTLLQQAGIEPTIVENGALCVQAWEDQDWDLILMDVQMPVMDGTSAAREIRQREAGTGRQRTPIIALTANTMSHQVAEYLACGMDGHLSKPIEAAKLFEGVETALAKAQRRDVAA